MIFVTVGTHEQPFNRLIQEVDRLKRENIIKDEVMVDVDVLSTYIQGLGGSVSSEYENSEGQGRIVIR